LEARPVQSDGKSKPEFRSTFLTQLSRLASTTKEELAAQQQRYKDVYDAHVRVRNKDIEAGDLVFVRTFAEAPDSPKLLVPSAGPYVVEARNERIFRVRTPSGIVQVNSDRVTKSPRPEDLPENVRCREPDDESRRESDAEDVGNTQEYVVDRLVGHEIQDSRLYLKVRWYGYEAADDTWELWHRLPERLVERYLRQHPVERHG
jgi:Chromo (CHRromatin Organisation MOdifier) domain